MKRTTWTKAERLAQRMAEQEKAAELKLESEILERERERREVERLMGSGRSYRNGLSSWT